MDRTGVDVVVVGAGLAGLSAARHLHAAGLEVVVLERSDGIGGRVSTDVQNGFRLDRGFQLFNPAYPEPPRLLSLDDLDLRPFTRGALVRYDGARHRLVDPRAEPTSFVATLRAPVGSLPAKAALAALSVRDAMAPFGRITAADTSTRDALRRAGVTGSLAERVVGRFLAGVFLESELATSSRFFHATWRSFVRGTPSVPALGMGELAAQLAAPLGPGVVRLDTEVRTIEAGGVRLADGRRVDSRLGTVVAADARGAHTLLPGLAVPPSNGVTTVYHAMTEAPLDEPILVLDGDDDLIVNSVVLTATAPAYAPTGWHLVSTSVLGAGHGAGLEPRVRARLAVLYATDTRSWEHVATYGIDNALPQMVPPFELRRSVRAGPGRYVCGDHRDTSSIQGAMVSGRRAAQALIADAHGVTRHRDGDLDV